MILDETGDWAKGVASKTEFTDDRILVDHGKSVLFYCPGSIFINNYVNDKLSKNGEVKARYISLFFTEALLQRGSIKNWFMTSFLNKLVTNKCRDIDKSN